MLPYSSTFDKEIVSAHFYQCERFACTCVFLGYVILGLASVITTLVVYSLVLVVVGVIIYKWKEKQNIAKYANI